MKLSIIIPCYNEEKNIALLVEKVKKVNLGALEKEIIIVDNNSSDNSLAVAQSISDVRVIREMQQGKGAAVKRGFKEAQGDIVMVQDADLEYDPNDYTAVLQPILDGTTEVTNGVRIDGRRKDDHHKMLYFLGLLGNNAITLTTNLLYGNHAGEYEGCYKAFTKRLIDSIEIKTNNFDYDNELLCKILKRGYTVVDVPIRYYPRNYAEGKKINWKHGFLILWTIIKYRFID